MTKLKWEYFPNATWIKFGFTLREDVPISIFGTPARRVAMWRSKKYPVRIRIYELKDGSHLWRIGEGRDVMYSNSGTLKQAIKHAEAVLKDRTWFGK